MKTVCENNKCTGCMACLEVCGKHAIRIVDSLDKYQAVIDEETCVHCNACHAVCQNNHAPACQKPIAWWQGWTNDEDLRERASSGGFATAISKAFIQSGGVVCGCMLRDGEFKFEIAENIESLDMFTGSKYAKSNPGGIYKIVKDYLQRKIRVLFIGLPCQVAAMKNYISDDYGKLLYTVDLICHGTPSPKLLESFLNQYKCSLFDMKKIRFRVNQKYKIYGDGKGIITEGVSDKYSIAFVNSLIATENCYQCHYAKKERISDLTIGDSWGSELSESEQKKGISLGMCQTEKGRELLEIADLHLEKVDLETAIEQNAQLNHPAVCPEARSEFFRKYNGKNFNKLVFWSFPKQCFRQDVKQLLIKLKFLR